MLRLDAALRGRAPVVPRAQARAAARASLWFFAFVGGVTVVKSATNATFLARRSPESLPWLYLATAGTVTAVTLLAGRRLAQVSSRRLLRRGSLIAAVLLPSLAAAASAGAPGALAALYVAGEAYATALSVLFWARLTDVFDPRTAKKVFGRIGAAGMAGAVLGGALVHLFSARVPPLLWCGLGPGLLLALRPLLGPEGRSPPARDKPPVLRGFRYVVGARFPRGLALLTLALAVQTATVDYAFRLGATEALGANEARLTGLFGQLNAVVGVFAIFVQVLLTRQILARLGVFVFLSLVPLGVVGLGAWASLASRALLPLYLLKALEMAGSLSLHQPALQLLYGPMPPEVRNPVRALVDGAVKKLGGAVGGVALLLVGIDMSTALGLVVAIGGGIVLFLPALRAWYRSALAERVARAEGRPPVIDPGDRATRQALLAGLEDPDPEKVKAVLTVLGRLRRPGLRARIARLLAHPRAEVRSAALDLVERRRPATWIPPIADALGAAPGGEGQVELARALLALDPARARAWLAPLLARPGADPKLLAVAVAAHRPVDPDRAAPALERVLSHLAVAPPEARRGVLEILGPAAPLARLAEDPHPEVRGAALAAIGRSRDPRLAPVGIAALEARETRAAAAEALVALGDAAVEGLARALDDRARALEVRRRMPAILRRIGSPRAGAALLRTNLHDDASLRFCIVRALARLRREQPRLVFERERAESAALRRLRAWRHYRPMAQDLAASGRFGLLHRAVAERVDQNLQASLVYLSLVHEAEPLRRALEGLRAGAWLDAIELIDVALEGRPIRRPVLELLEAPMPAPDAGRAEAHLASLERGRDRVLALIAHETSKRWGWAEEETLRPAPGTEGEASMSRALIDKVFVLEEVQLFRGLSVDDLAAVAELCDEAHAPPGHVFYRQGEPGDALFVIVTGEVHLERDGAPLLELRAGDSFGQVSLLDRGERPVTATAGADGADVLRLERQPFMDLVHDRPQVAGGLFEILARRLRELVAMSKGRASA
jgi:hypothetical protein